MPLYQDAEAKMTLTRVATAPALVAEISKLTGSKLEVSPALATEVLMVSVVDTKVVDVLAKLAIAATASWQPVEGGYRLMPDGPARSIEASSERARRLLSINDGLKKKQAAEIAQRKTMADAAAKARAGTKGEVEDDVVEAMGFAGMFGGGNVDAFIPMLDLSALANMEMGDRIVFATGANSAQRPLRGVPGPLIMNLIAKHNRAAKTMGSRGGEMPEEMAALMKGPLADRMKRMSQQISAPPAKIVVVASRGANAMMMFGGDMGLDVRLEVRAYAANGALLIEESGSLDTDMMAMFAAIAAAKKPAVSVAKTTPIGYSEDAKAFLAMAGGENPFMSGGFDKGLSLSPSLREKMFSPDRFDPLALVPGEGLAALAKARRKPLVASIPDAAYPGIVTNAAPKTIEDVEASVKTGTMRLVPDTTFLVVRAAEPDTARRNRIDRAALARFMSAVDDHEAPTLDELAEFASKTPPPARSALSMKLLMTFAPSAIVSMTGMVSWDALRLYAGLNPVQRTGLASGAKVPIAQLTPAAQSALRTMVYGAAGRLSIERPGASDETDIFTMSMNMMMGGGGTDARDEPTEIAPRGLPTDGYLQAAVSNDTVIRPVGADGPIYYALGTDELAMFKLFSSAGIAEAEEAMKLPDAGRVGSRTLWNLRGYVAPGVYVSGVLTDDRTPKNGATVSLKNLPADIQARIAQKTEKLKKGPLGAMMSSMGGGFGKQQGQP